MLVLFDLSHITDRVTIEEATLEVYVEAHPISGSGITNVHAVSREWNETEVTWNKATDSDWWDGAGGDYNSDVEASFPFTSNAVGTWQDFDVTSLVQDFVDNPGSNYGFFLYMNSVMVAIEYTSSESNNTDERPKLTVVTDDVGIINDHNILNELFKLIKTQESYMMFIPFSGNSNVSIYDVKGKQLARFNTSKSNQWHRIPGSITPGIHIVRINNQGKNIVKKLWFVK